MKAFDKAKFHEDESKSNHAVVAMIYDDCPIKKVCFGIATGFGGVPVSPCQYVDLEVGGCNYEVLP